MSDNDIYKAPEATLVDENNTDEIELAGRWYRLGGALIDGLVFFVLYMPVLMVMGIWETLMKGQQPNFITSLLLAAVCLVIFVLIHGYFLVTNGQTIGKKLLGTKIVSAETHQILPLGKVMALRVVPIQLASLIPLVGPWLGLVDILFIFGKRKQCVHDMIAGTIVIKAQ